MGGREVSPALVCGEDLTEDFDYLTEIERVPVESRTRYNFPHLSLTKRTYVEFIGTNTSAVPFTLTQT